METQTKTKRNRTYTSITTDKKITQRWSQCVCVAGFLTAAGSGRLAGPGQHGKYTESECCWEAGWHLVGYTSEKQKWIGQERKQLGGKCKIVCCWFHRNSLGSVESKCSLSSKTFTCFQIIWPTVSLWDTDRSSVLRTFCNQLRHDEQAEKNYKKDRLI